MSAQLEFPVAKPLTQNEAVLLALKAGRRLTPKDAQALCGSMRLAARISNLREAGHTIHSRRVTVSGGASVSEYWMDG